MIFSRNIIVQVFLTNQKFEMKMPQIFKQNANEISENMEVGKKFRFGRVKIGKIK